MSYESILLGNEVFAVISGAGMEPRGHRVVLCDAQHLLLQETSQEILRQRENSWWISLVGDSFQQNPSNAFYFFPLESWRP